MGRISLYILILLFRLFIQDIGAQTIDAGNCKPGKEYPAFTSDGSWCWFSDPRAIHYKDIHNRIYAGWITSSGNIEAGYYDLTDNAVQTEIVHREFEPDDHDNPALFIDNTGRIVLFYSHHAQKSPIFMKRFSVPEDLSYQEPERMLYLNDTITYKRFRDSYTYVDICRLSDEHNRLYIFWRGMDFKPNFSFSDDDGISWSRGKILILPERIYKDRRPYFKVCSNGKDKIHIAFTDGHPRDEPTNSIYYALYKNGSFYKADGKKIADLSETPFTPGESDIVYDAGITREKAWVWDIAEDTAERPIIVYSRFPNDSSHLYYYAIWYDNQWNNIFLVNSGGWFPQTPKESTEPEPNYSGGLVLDHDDPSVVYLSVKRDIVFEIEKWKTIDNGTKWITEQITCNSDKDNVRPFAIRNTPDSTSMQIIWMKVDRYRHYTDYHTSLRMW